MKEKLDIMEDEEVNMMDRYDETKKLIKEYWRYC